ncbi:hypothetical protein BUALT_Bualt09G0049700 [Buddleja alternifolia]|uniref:SBP-type domain-containing protein n=1 Tax=Buddleja alternifolia TaxID=168488 RepID=A0AAV6X8M4_9LAMI|nr:hypothetical protein BUALT_Bualt09G0049700 [Buddleja alternifolia]
MERNSENSSGLEWENLAVFGGKTMEFPPNMSCFSMYSSGSTDHDFGRVNEPMIGLRLGSQKESGDTVFHHLGSIGNTKAASMASSLPMKRSRASYQNMQNPCCQVEGCNLDLKLAKDYHRRHRICESHSKSPKVVVADHTQQNMLLNGLPMPVSNSTWDNANTSMLRQARDSHIRPPKAGGFERTLYFSSDEVPSSVSNLHMGSERLSSVRSSSPRVLDQCLHVATTNSPIAPDHPSAHSFLSSNSWSLNEHESMSMECLVPGNYNNPLMMRLSEPHQWSLFDSNNTNIAATTSAEQSAPHFSMNLHSPSTSHLQEYQLFKAPYDSACFYSPQR